MLRSPGRNLSVVCSSNRPCVNTIMNKQESLRHTVWPDVWTIRKWFEKLCEINIGKVLVSAVDLHARKAGILANVKQPLPTLYRIFEHTFILYSFIVYFLFSEVVTYTCFQEVIRGQMGRLAGIGRIRTRDLQIPLPRPYPLGHRRAVSCRIWSSDHTLATMDYSNHSHEVLSLDWIYRLTWKCCYEIVKISSDFILSNELLHPVV